MHNPGVDLSSHGFFGVGNPGKLGRRRVSPVFPDGPETDTSIEDARLVPEIRVQSDGADDFDSGTVTVSRIADGNEAVQIVPRDSLRTRTLIVNNGTVAVLIGKLSSGLTQGNGFLLLANQSVEILAKGRVHGVVVPSAAALSIAPLSVWVERG